MKRLPGILSAILLTLMALNAGAQEMIFCPVTAVELTRRCTRTTEEIQALETRIADANRLLQDPNVVLARVERQAGESVASYRLRVAAQEGVPAPKSNAWLPLEGLFFDPESQTCFVAMQRRDYWRYVWESLGEDLGLAQRTFSARERLSLREKAQQQNNAQWGVGRWEADLALLNQFRFQCCREQKMDEAGRSPDARPPDLGGRLAPPPHPAAQPAPPTPLDGLPGNPNP
jgi:hypothetical protein